MISFGAPAPALAIWHWCLDLIRRVAGQQEPAWRCAEYLAAEFLSGVPDVQGGPGTEEGTSPVFEQAADPGIKKAAGPANEQPAGPALEQAAGPTIAQAACQGSASESAADSLARLEGAPAADGAAAERARPTERQTRGAGPTEPQVGDAGMLAWSEACATVREALASIGSAADVDVIQNEVAGSGIDDLDAWELDARLRRLVRVRQSLAWRQGRILAALAALRLHRDLGFDTFDDWVADRLAMSPRRARYLISLDRRLRGLPLLADA